MESLSKVLEGKKTYIGLIVTVVGMTSLASIITPAESTELLDNIFKIVGIVLAVYGRAVTKTK